MIPYQFRRAVDAVIRRFHTINRAKASADLTLTGSAQDITGATLTLPAGVYLIIGTFDHIEQGAGDEGWTAVGELVVGADTQNGQALLTLDNSHRATVSQFWSVTLTTSTTCKLQAYKNGGTGTSITGHTHTTITAIRIA